MAFIENGNPGEAERLKVGQGTEIEVDVRHRRHESCSVRRAEPSRVRRLTRGTEEREVTEDECVVRGAPALRDE